MKQFAFSTLNKALQNKQALLWEKALKKYTILQILILKESKHTNTSDLQKRILIQVKNVEEGKQTMGTMSRA